MDEVQQERDTAVTLARLHAVADRNRAAFDAFARMMEERTGKRPKPKMGPLAEEDRGGNGDWP